MAVPAVQAAILGLTERPLVPGPHELDGLFLAPSDQATPLSIVWLGDSLASGVGPDTPGASFPSMSAALYRSAHERSVQVTCLASAGARAADVLAAQVPVAVALLGAGSVAILLVGSNDVGSLNRPRRFRRQYRAILDALVGTGATVVAIGLPDIGSATVLAQPLRAIIGWVGRRADRDVRRLAAVHGAHYIDINCRPPAELMPPVFLAADNYHPNDETYRFWADRLATFLRPILHPRAA
jgi:lysophospholipase L1-like esterase